MGRFQASRNRSICSLKCSFGATCPKIQLTSTRPSILPRLDVQCDAIISDPPYGITACDWDILPPLGRFWEMVERKTKPTANIVLFGCGRFAVDLINSQYKWYRYDLIWQKNNKVGFLNANKMPLRNHETVLIFARPGFRKEATYNPQKIPGGRAGIRKPPAGIRHKKSSVYLDVLYTASVSDGTLHPCSVLQYNNEGTSLNNNNRLHPTQKPLALMEWLIKTYTNEGDTVIDPFMGSGTTGVACAKLGRRFIGIEREETYYGTALKRIQEIVGSR